MDQHLDNRLYLADSLRTAVRVCLAAIPYMDEALSDLGTLSFLALHLLSASERHSSVIVELLCLIERMQELQTEVQGLI